MCANAQIDAYMSQRRGPIPLWAALLANKKLEWRTAEVLGETGCEWGRRRSALI